MDKCCHYIRVDFPSLDNNFSKTALKGFISWIVYLLTFTRYIFSWIYKIWHCREQNLLVPYFSIRYLWILDPPNLGGSIIMDPRFGGARIRKYQTEKYVQIFFVAGEIHSYFGGQMLQWWVASVKDGLRNLPLKFGQN